MSVPQLDVTKQEIDVTKVEVLKDYLLYLEFEDGSKGTLDVSKIISFSGVFEPLKDRGYFSTVFINPETGTICWDNGADIAPAFLYKHIVSSSDEMKFYTA